jgi:hypothetical protein
MRVETLELRDWEELESGMILAETNEWILMRHIFADYMVDGYKIYRKDIIENRIHEDEERIVERVLTLKGVTEEIPDGFKLGKTMEMLQWIGNKYGFAEFQDVEEELTFAIIEGEKDGEVWYEMILPDGTTETQLQFPLDEICVIAFDSDYFRSVGLLWRDSLK